MYFVQSVGDPGSGLIAQPTRSLLKSWDADAATIGVFMAALALPWALKPVFGLVSDFVPIFGSRRRAWLLIATAGATLGLLAAWLVEVPPGARALLLALLLVPTAALAFGDVLIDALMIETGRPRGLTGRLQSVQWASAYAALLLTGVLAGALAERALQHVAYVLCAALCGASFLLALSFVREEPVARDSPRETFAALARACRAPVFLTVCAFLLIWNFNPLWTSVLYLHVTEALGFSEQAYGVSSSASAAGAMLASVSYGLYCTRVRLSRLLYLAVGAGVLSSLAYWRMDSAPALYAAATLSGFAYMTGTLVQLDVAARVVPIAAAATLFALVMALSNLSSAASEAVGGLLYARWQVSVGEPVAYAGVVLLAAAFTLSSVLLLPVLRRQRPDWWR